MIQKVAVKIQNAIVRVIDAMIKGLRGVNKAVKKFF